MKKVELINIQMKRKEQSISSVNVSVVNRLLILEISYFYDAPFVTSLRLSIKYSTYVERIQRKKTDVSYHIISKVNNLSKDGSLITEP